MNIRHEYKRSDFTTVERGKYAARIAEETNVIVLDPEVAKAFPNDKAVNDALRGLLEVAETYCTSNKGLNRTSQKTTRQLT